jgi:hypothetical protein
MPSDQDLRVKESTFYPCRKCGRVIPHRLPRLRGEFAHFRCERAELASGWGGHLKRRIFDALARA